MGCNIIIFLHFQIHFYFSDRFLVFQASSLDDAKLDLSPELRRKTDSGTFSYSCDSPGSHSSDTKDEKEESNEYFLFDPYNGFKFFGRMSPRQSEADPKSFANVAAKPPAAFGADYLKSVIGILNNKIVTKKLINWKFI